MSEESTIGKVKEFLTANFQAFEIQTVNVQKAGKMQQAKSLGRFVFNVEAIEKRPYQAGIAFDRHRNFRLYVIPPDENTEKFDPNLKENEGVSASFEETQGPSIAAGTPVTPTPVPTFTDDARTYLIAQVKANILKAGAILSTDNDMERAMATVIDASGKEKRVVLKRGTKGIESEDYTPLLGTVAGIAK